MKTKTNWITSFVAALFLLGDGSRVAHAGKPEQRLSVEDAMRRANDYFLANFSIGTSGWKRAAYQTGNVRAWQTLDVQAYYDRAAAWGEYNNWKRGPEGLSHADAHCCGQAYLDLYLADPQPVRTNNISDVMNTVLDTQYYADDWWWIDAIYMAAPTLARLSALNKDDRYLSAMYTMYLDTKVQRGLFNPAQGLWWRDPDYANTDTYWGRGNGWVIAACARVLEQLPPGDTTYRPEFESMLQSMATALLPWQQPDGFWRSDLTHPSNYPNPETSCTAFFTYALAYGLNEGILIDSPGANYSDAVSNAWNGMVLTALHDNGKLGYAQNVGKAPGAATYDTDNDYAYGAFLLAGSEVLRMLGGPAPIFPSAGADQHLMDDDGDYVAPISLSATNSVLRSGTVESYSWWSGSTFLGSGPELNSDVPLGTNTITLLAAHSDGNTYAGKVTITVSSPALVVTASGYQAGTGNTPDKTLDGNLDTRWSQVGDTGSEWIQYQLLKPHTLDHVDIAFFAGDQRQGRLAIWLSKDGSEANLVRVLPPHGDNASYVTSSGTSLGLETFSFPPKTVGLLRIQGWGNSSSAWNSITEVGIPSSVNDQTDGDGNGLPDSWEIHFFSTNGLVASTEIGGSGLTLRDAYVLGLDPTNPDTTPMIGIHRVANHPALSLSTVGAFGVGYQGLARKYNLLCTDSLTNTIWSVVPGYNGYIGSNLPLEMVIPGSASAQYYRIESWLETNQ